MFVWILWGVESWIHGTVGALLPGPDAVACLMERDRASVGNPPKPGYNIEKQPLCSFIRSCIDIAVCSFDLVFIVSSLALCLLSLALYLFFIRFRFTSVLNLLFDLDRRNVSCKTRKGVSDLIFVEFLFCFVWQLEIIYRGLRIPSLDWYAAFFLKINLLFVTEVFAVSQRSRPRFMVLIHCSNSCFSFRPWCVALVRAAIHVPVPVHNAWLSFAAATPVLVLVHCCAVPVRRCSSSSRSRCVIPVRLWMIPSYPLCSSIR